MSLYADWDPERCEPDYDRHPSPDVRARWVALCALRDASPEPELASRLSDICAEAESELQHALDAWESIQ